MEVKDIPDARVEERHAAHDTGLVCEEDGEVGKEIVRAVWLDARVFGRGWLDLRGLVVEEGEIRILDLGGFGRQVGRRAKAFGQSRMLDCLVVRELPDGINRSMPKRVIRRRAGIMGNKGGSRFPYGLSWVRVVWRGDVSTDR